MPIKKAIVSGLVVIEAITALSNSQSNCLVAGLLIFAFLFLEKKQIGLASLMLVLTVYIKLFGLIAFVLFLFYPKKWKAVGYSLAWFLILGAMPLLLISFDGLLSLYRSWWNLLVNDHSISFGFSVMAWLHTWFGLSFQKNIVTLGGMLIFCLPLIRYRLFVDLRYRMLYLSSILIWVVIFNHKAESPSFVIAVSGIAIWFFCQEYRLLNLILLLLTIIFTILVSTDLFPSGLRDQVMIPYVVKVVPCLLVWLKVNYDLILFKAGEAKPV